MQCTPHILYMLCNTNCTHSPHWSNNDSHSFTVSLPAHRCAQWLRSLRAACTAPFRFLVLLLSVFNPTCILAYCQTLPFYGVTCPLFSASRHNAEYHNSCQHHSVRLCVGPNQYSAPPATAYWQLGNYYMFPCVQWYLWGLSSHYLQSSQQYCVVGIQTV